MACRSRWWRGLGLSFLLLAACDGAEDAKSEPTPTVVGDSCKSADAYFSAEIGKSVESQRRACVRDDDCTLWSPTLSCEPSFQVLNCPFSVRSDSVSALEQERSRLTAETCPMLDAGCGGVGVSCLPSRAVCKQFVCALSNEPAPGPVPCSVDATSSELLGARIHIEADDCRFRVGEGGDFRYRVELPSALAYQLPGAKCGSCKPDGTVVSSVVRAMVVGLTGRYCPDCDVGCCAPNSADTWTLAPQTLEAVLRWPGRSWDGPSDTSTPLGPEFVRGSYNVDVTLAVPGVGTLTALLPIVVE